ncbi:MAG: hemerythrin domain-containing protein, partial [Acidimicrobiales bacterium]
MSIDGLEFLTLGHRDVEKLFAEVHGGSGGKEEVIDKIVRELSSHDAIERELLYPLVRKHIPDNGEGLADHSIDEHEEAARLLLEIGSTTSLSERDELLKQLIAGVKSHVEVEEGQVFPQLREAIPQSELVDLRVELEATKRRAPHDPSPHGPRSGIGAKAADVAGAAARLTVDSPHESES